MIRIKIWYKSRLLLIFYDKVGLFGVKEQNLIKEIQAKIGGLILMKPRYKLNNLNLFKSRKNDIKLLTSKTRGSPSCPPRFALFLGMGKGPNNILMAKAHPDS